MRSLYGSPLRSIIHMILSILLTTCVTAIACLPPCGSENYPASSGTDAACAGNNPAATPTAIPTITPIIIMESISVTGGGAVWIKTCRQRCFEPL